MTKPSRRLAAALLLAFALASPLAYSQGARRKKNRGEKSPVQAVAIEALESASYELQEVEDLATRVALTEGIVKLLADKRPERCRQLLESLFDEALKPERTPAPGVLRKIMAVAAGYDPKLAQNFAEKYALSQNQRESLQASLDRLKTAPAETQDGSHVEELLRRAEEIRDQSQRDRIYYDASLAAVNEQQYDAALDIADKMAPKAREAARQFIILMIALDEIKEGRLEKAEEMAMRDDDLARRAFLLNTIARAASQGANKDLNRATALLNEAVRIAWKLESVQERVSTLAAASTVFARFEDIRSAELLREAIKEANKLEEFTGEASVVRAIESGGFWYVYTLFDHKLTFSEAVSRQGRKDFYTALRDIQTLKSRVARLKAVIELCRSALSRP